MERMEDCFKLTDTGLDILASKTLRKECRVRHNGVLALQMVHLSV